MSFINKPKVGHPSLPTNALGLTRRQYEGSMSTLCARLRARLDYRGGDRGVLGPGYATGTIGQAFGNRLLVEDDRLFRERCARLQFGSWTHALDRERRQRRKPRPHLHRHLRGWRLPVHRPGSAGARNPAQREHALFDREQRGLRSHQGPVLRVGGHRHSRRRRAMSTKPRPSTRFCWRSRSARHSWREASPATRRSSCR
jgi:hypothetical protein